MSCNLKTQKFSSSQRGIALSTAVVIAVLLATGVSPPVSAQTSGSWSSSGSGNWSAPANWLGGAVPDAGGVATFNNALGQLANITVTVDSVNRTLGEIRWDQSFMAGIGSSGGGTIVMGPTGLTLNAIRSNVSSPFTIYINVNNITAPIAGTGNLVKTGAGVASIGGANTFTGNVQINQGELWFNSGDVGFGNASNQVNLAGGVLGVATANLVTSRTFNVGPEGGTIRAFRHVTLNGALNGSGTLAAQTHGFTLRLNGNLSGFDGILRSDLGSIVNLGGSSALGGSAEILVGGTLTLDNTTVNAVNRLNGRSITSVGGALNQIGSAAGASTEQAGTLELRRGMTTMTLSPNVAHSTTFGFSGLDRTVRSTVFFRSAGLGSAAGPGVGNVQFATSPGALVGSGGDPETSTKASILPFAVGSQDPAATTGTSPASVSFVTWDSSTQKIIPLNLSSGYHPNLSTAAADDNVNLGPGSSSVAAGGQTVNALRLQGLVTVNGGASDILTVTSGGVLAATPSGSLVGTFVNAPLNFGGTEGVIFAMAEPFSEGLLRIDGVISGSNGVTKAGNGVLILAGANSYSGTTTLSQGEVRVGGGIVADGVNGYFGNDGSAIQMQASRLLTTGDLVIERDIAVQLGAGSGPGIGTQGASSGTTSPPQSVTVNGNISLDVVSPDVLTRHLVLEGRRDLPGSLTINGDVSGAGGLRANFASYTILAGNNTYSGDTLVGTSAFQGGSGNGLVMLTETWDVRSNTAFGTGRVYFSNVGGGPGILGSPISRTGTIVSNGAAPVTVANDIVMTSGFAQFGGNQSITLNGDLYVNGALTNNSVITAGGTQPLVLNGTINGGGIIKNGSGIMVMNGASTYSGQTIIRQGVLSVSTIGQAGVAGNIGQAPAASNYLVLSGNAVGATGTLRYTGAGETTDRLFTLQGSGGTIDASGTGALVFSNTGALGAAAGNVVVNDLTLTNNAGMILVPTSVAAQLVVGSTLGGTPPPGLVPGTSITEVGPNYIRLSATGTNTPMTGQSLTFLAPAGMTTRTLNLVGNNIGLNTIAAGIVDGTNIAVAVNKSGVGTWQLTGANSWSGGTQVDAGRLLINNSTGSGTGSGSVMVATGAILGGAGFIVPAAGQQVLVNGTLAPGNSSGQLTFGSLAVSTFVDLNGTYAFELSTAGTAGVLFNTGLSSPGTPHAFHDVISVFGMLDLTGSQISLTALGLTGFDSGQNYSWLIASTHGGTLAGLPAISLVSGSEFQVPPAARFFLGHAGGNLFLNYEAIPEPALAGWAGLLTVLLASRVRRRVVESRR